MASLYIKDGEANLLAERLARARGVTKTAAVKLALTRELEREVDAICRPSARSVLQRHWRDYPPPAIDAPTVDKSFYDWLSDEGGRE